MLFDLLAVLLLFSSHFFINVYMWLIKLLEFRSYILLFLRCWWKFSSNPNYWIYVAKPDTGSIYSSFKIQLPW